MTKEQETQTPGSEQGQADETLAEGAPKADPATASGVAGEPTDVSPEGFAALLEEARARADDYWNQLLRARAENENLRRRQAAELEKAHKFALDGFVRELLPVRDSLELGQAAARDERADLEKLREGTDLTLKLLVDAMAKFGVESVDPEGEPFNPEFHQAMSTQPRADVAPNTVVSVIQRGYLLNGRLARPALVVVSQAPA